MIFVMQAGANRHEHICASLELFARDVMPEFKEREPVAAKAKEQRLAATVDRLRSLKTIDRHPDLDLVVPANPTV